MAVDGGLLGPPGWVISAFEYATGRADRSSTITAQIRAAREAGYTGTRPQLIAIGQGLISRDAFQLGQGGGPGSDRNPNIGPPVQAIPGFPGSTPPLIPSPIPSPGVPGSPPVRPPPSVPGLPSGGPSIADRIPPSTAIGAAGRTLLQSILRGGWAGLLFYPREAGRGSALCVETQYGPYCPPVVQAVPAAVPLPSGPRRRSRRIPGTAAPPRRRERGRVAQPAAPAVPRGRPVTISRPQVIPQPRVITRPFPAPRSLPPPGASFPTPGPVARPAAIPAARPGLLPAVAAAAIPAAVGLLLGSQTAARSQTYSPAGSIPGQSVAPIPGLANPPQLGQLELPGVGPSPSPLTAAQLAPLTSFNAAVAQSPAEELDRQCRERAKRKRKKREPRSVCYRGTFTETKSSTRKVRKEKIPCQ